ncbi:RING finger protein 145 [Pitangus sulphuratus]|nr:RING finger protein 145 [Pitangus sulphuratus]
MRGAARGAGERIAEKLSKVETRLQTKASLSMDISKSAANSQKGKRMAAKEKLEAVLNVALRVPSIMLLDVLYRWDVSSFFQQIQRSSLHNNPLFQYKYLALNMHYVGYILSVVLLTLPRQHLVQLYLYFLTALLLYAGHQISRLQSEEPISTYLTYTMTLEKLPDYVRSELESGYEGPMYLEPLSMNRFMTALVVVVILINVQEAWEDSCILPGLFYAALKYFAGQLVVCTLCSCVMKTKQIWLFSAHMLPLLARLCLVPLETIVIINKFAMIFTGLEVLYFLASNLLVPYNLAKSAYRELVQVVEVYGLLALGMSLWNQLVVPVLFMVFWLVLFALQIYSYFSTRDQPASRERLLFLFLTSIAECCSTPYSLLGLVFTVSFVALGVLTLCKFYLQGYRAFMNDPAMNRGMTEGVTLLILAVQTGLIELQVVHRAFLLSIILFIVVASILQSMLEIADPIVLALGASRDKSLWKHFRAVSLCLFLLVFPAYMAYMICQFFHMDFWLLIIISSSILTSLQVLGTLFIYVLFMVEEFRKEPVENMDDVIYYVNGTYRLLEFLVALCVVAYGVSETIFGEWTVMGSVIIFIHSYYNVWLRAQLGWKSFLLRRDAVNKIKSLPVATKEQLEQHNDICAICYQLTGNAKAIGRNRELQQQSGGCSLGTNTVGSTATLSAKTAGGKHGYGTGKEPDRPGRNSECSRGSNPHTGPEDVCINIGMMLRPVQWDSRLPRSPGWLSGEFVLLFRDRDDQDDEAGAGRKRIIVPVRTIPDLALSFRAVPGVF